MNRGIQGAIVGAVVGFLIAAGLAWSQGAIRLPPIPPGGTVMIDSEQGVVVMDSSESVLRDAVEAAVVCGGPQLRRIETLVRAILVTQDGMTFGKHGWNGLSAFKEARRQTPGYLDPEPLP